MQVKHLDHLNMGVIDLDQTIDWYRRVFGFRVVERKFSGGVDWAVIRSGEAMLCLYEHPEFSRYNAQALYREKRLAIAHFGMRITDAEAWQRIVERERLEFYYDSPTHYGHSTAWYVLDPNGFGIEVALWANDTVTFDHDMAGDATRQASHA